jgi:FkbM family methyltransferase
MKNVRQCRPLVHWAAARVSEGLVLDVGAHFGSFSVMLLRKRPWVFCHAFEPNPQAIFALRRMMIRNRLTDRLTVHETALMDVIGLGVLHTPKDRTRSGLATLGYPMRFSNGDAMPVDMTTLDSWAAEQKLGRIELIKIDVEGAELFTLQGAVGIIKKHHPYLILEYQTSNLNQFNVGKGAVQGLIESWGYTWNQLRRDLLCEWHS